MKPENPVSRLTILLWLTAFLNIFDLLITWWSVSRLGTAVELNPLLRYLFSINPIAAVSFKIAILAIFLIVISFCARKYYHLACQGVFAVVVVSGIVAVLNIHHMLPLF